MSDETNPIMEQRQRIHDALSEAIKLEPDFEQAVLSGWVLVAELMVPGDDDYELSLIVRSGDATGTSDLRPWTARGWLDYAASQDSLHEYDEDEDDDDPA